MRLEATIADIRGDQLQELADELHVPKSQLVDEALALFMKAYLETKRGRRVAIIDAETQATVCEVASPSLSQVEWALHKARVSVSARGLKKVGRLIDKPPAPTAALRKAMSARVR